MFEIKNPKSGSILQVAQYDFHNKMNYYDAKKACEALGDGWRLPTIFELKLIYKELHLKRKGNFKKKGYYQDYGYYLSELDQYGELETLNFGDGDTYGSGKATNSFVRVVRDFEKNNQEENIKARYVKKIEDKYSTTIEYRMPDSIKLLYSKVPGEIDLNFRVFAENNDFMNSKIVLALTYYAEEALSGTVLHESVAEVLIDNKDVLRLDNEYSYSGLSGSYSKLEIYDEILVQKSSRTEQIQFYIDLATLIKFVNAENIEIRVNKKKKYEAKIYFEQIINLIGFYNAIFDPDFKKEILKQNKKNLSMKNEVDRIKYKRQMTTPPPSEIVTLYSKETNKSKISKDTNKSKISKDTNKPNCFIITATMNDPYHPIVDEFRAYRDRKLLTNFIGKMFVNFYYKVGPFAALFISKSSILRNLSFKLFVNPVYKRIKND